MGHAHWIVVVQIALLSAGWSAAGTGAELDQKAAGYFTVKCGQIEYKKIVQIPDLEVSPTRLHVEEYLSLHCRIEIRDPNLVLGTCSGGGITQVAPWTGRDIDITSPPPFSQRLFYDRPGYHDRLIPPPAESRWRRFLRSTLRLSPGARPLPQLVSELQPSPLSFWLDPDVLRQGGGELAYVEGFFYALVAESIEHVDVPFEPNGPWVRLTPELEIRLRDIFHNGSTISFHVDRRGVEHPSTFRLAVGDPLPDRLVAGLAYLPKNGPPIPRQPAGGVPRWIGGPQRDPSGWGGALKAIRFVIAVHPRHCKIPFELRHVPLPDPNQPVDRP